jgi:hypothetical protein
MASVAYYRQEAERARAAAYQSQDAETVLRWLRIAKDYENLAESLEAVPDTPPPTMHVPMQQQQPVQQQQSKTEPDDKK